MRERTLLIRCSVLVCCFVLLLSRSAQAEKPLTSGDGAPARTGLKADGRNSTALDANTLVREVVYNELHDHDAHGFWRYWIKRNTGKTTVLQEQIETSEGPIARVELANGQPLSADAQAEQDRLLQHLITSPNELAEHRKAYADDERRIGRILALLPDAFVYEAEPQQALTEGLCYHLRFKPNPEYPAHSIEARIFHAMTGELWISLQNKRLVRLEGRIGQNVDFGFGILGRLYKDGWFRLDRTRVSNAVGVDDWKTELLEVHMAGRAMLFKSLDHETSEVRGGFVPVPAGLSLSEAAQSISASRQLGTYNSADGAKKGPGTPRADLAALPKTHF